MRRIFDRDFGIDNSPDVNICGMCRAIKSPSWVLISNRTDSNGRKLHRCFRITQIAETRLLLDSRSLSGQIKRWPGVFCGAVGVLQKTQNNILMFKADTNGHPKPFTCHVLQH